MAWEGGCYQWLAGLFLDRLHSHTSTFFKSRPSGSIRVLIDDPRLVISRWPTEAVEKKKKKKPSMTW